MSLQFYFGPSDEENSRSIYASIIEQAMAEEKRNFLVLVPDQFTMQTQKELVTMHPRGGILNIDVLSFGRLGHRVFEEVGKEETVILDDTGKSLVIQKVAGNLKEQLPVLGKFLHKQGYIHEIKSAISEFMQYGIGTQDVSKLIDYAQKRGALSCKLKDLETLYKGFSDYVSGKYVTTEETLEVLRKSLQKSAIVKDSVCVLDGFTGFTPIQNRLIQELMVQCKQVIVVLNLGKGENPYEQKGQQELFALTKKTVADLVRLAEEVQVTHNPAEDVYLEEKEEKRDTLRFLSQNVFRYKKEVYTGPLEGLHICEYLDQKQEVHQTALEIKRLVQQGYSYRDIAIVTGDLETYGPYVESEFQKLELPCYIDRTRNIVLNPMIEGIRSVLELYIRNFPYESVFHYLRSGISDIPKEDVDLLENYVRKTGAKGFRSYDHVFVQRAGYGEGKDNQQVDQRLMQINATRETFVKQVAKLRLDKKAKASVYINGLYEFLLENKVQERLEEYSRMFAEKEDLAKTREYAQIYRLVMDLLDQVYSLLGEEEISMEEFLEILEAGFGEIEVGTIPQNVDRILVGDMERTRIKSVRVMFFLGVNDGNIPRNASNGGIISDMDREFLQTSGTELAPTPRQQMFIQRFYLYLCLSRPKDKLYVSFACMNRQGKSMRPAYLIDTLKKMFPKLSLEYPQNDPLSEQILSYKDGLDYLAGGINRFACGVMPKEEYKDFYTLYRAYGEGEQAKIREKYTDLAFQRYQESFLSKAVSEGLYGKILENSVSRLETFSQCAYKHFLQYGLRLREREELGFEAVDLGNVYHTVLENFSKRLETDRILWTDFTEEYVEEAVDKAMEELAVSYGFGVLYRSAQNEYAMVRMKRVLRRTITTLQKQLKKGVFVPSAYEVSFQSVDKLQNISLGLSGEEKMRLMGRIDRIDEAVVEDKVYVKVVDYKSGDKKFDLAALYFGTQLQLVVYMDAALEYEQKKHPEKQIIPGAMLYYHVEDPLVETTEELTAEQIDLKIMDQLRTKGLVNSDDNIPEYFDRGLEGKSLVIPIERKVDGGLYSRSSVMSGEDLTLLSRFTQKKIADIGKQILEGNICVNPKMKGQNNSCTYCSYKQVCPYDKNIAGYEFTEQSMSDKDALLKIKEEC